MRPDLSEIQISCGSWLGSAPSRDGRAVARDAKAEKDRPCNRVLRVEVHRVLFSASIGAFFFPARMGVPRPKELHR
jgi:hypothetical protein